MEHETGTASPGPGDDGGHEAVTPNANRRAPESETKESTSTETGYDGNDPIQLMHYLIFVDERPYDDYSIATCVSTCCARAAGGDYFDWMNRVFAHIECEFMYERFICSAIYIQLQQFRAEAYRRQLRLEEAIDAYKDALQCIDLNEEGCKLALSQLQAWSCLGQCYLESLREQQAEECLLQFMRLNEALPEVGPENLEESVCRLYLVASTCLAHGRVSEMIKATQRGLQLLEGRETSDESQFVIAFQMKFHHQLAQAYQNAGRYKLALEAANKSMVIVRAAKRENVDVDSFWLLGNLQQQAGQHEEAIATLEQGLRNARHINNRNWMKNLLSRLRDLYEFCAGNRHAGLFIGGGHLMTISKEEAKAASAKCKVELREILGQASSAGSLGSWNKFRLQVLESTEDPELEQLERHLLIARENGNLAQELSTNLYIVGSAPTEERVRTAFSESLRCLEELESRDGMLGDVRERNASCRIQLSDYAIRLGELEKAESLLKVVLRSSQHTLETWLKHARLRGLGSASTFHHALKVLEDQKFHFMLMIDVQISIGLRSPSDPSLSVGETSRNAGITPTKQACFMRALAWAELSKSRVLMAQHSSGVSWYHKSSPMQGETREIPCYTFEFKIVFPADEDERLVESISHSREGLSHLQKLNMLQLVTQQRRLFG